MAKSAVDLRAAILSGAGRRVGAASPPVAGASSVAAETPDRSGALPGRRTALARSVSPDSLNPRCVVSSDGLLSIPIRLRRRCSARR